MKLLFVFLSIAFSFQAILSQTTIKGKITSIKHDELISFATIQLLDSTSDNLIKYTTTDSEGDYMLQIEKNGIYKIKITHIAHKLISKTLTLNGQEVNFDFQMEPNINSLKEVVLDFKPKVMRVFSDTITYNLKALTNGNEKTLTDIIEKLPGVEINNSGRIIVNGKMVKKLLIDGEELFKNQHQTTTESIGAKMIEGIRYLDKFNDFGNITGFNNKQTTALDVTIKNEFKNRVTGDVKFEGGHESKYLANANLFRFGGKVKLGYLGNWNTLGKQSITSLKYNELKGVGFDDVDENGFIIERNDGDSPKFLDPTLDVAERENLFNALSVIYKPSQSTKVSLLHIHSKTNQRQSFLNTRQFFNLSELDFFENRKVNSDFLLNSTILNFGYQPNEKSFIEYALNFNPQESNENFKINLSEASEVLNINQRLKNSQYRVDQKLSYLSRVTKNTLLKITGLHVNENKEEDLNILANDNLLPPINSNLISQHVFTNKNIYGYQLESVSKIKKDKLRFQQGILISKSSFKSNTNNNILFNNNFITNRIDSYFNTSYDKKINKRLRLTSKLGYQYINIKRFENSFTELIFQPSFVFIYKPKPSKTLNFEYNYSADLPNDDTVISNSIATNYYTLKRTSQVDENQILPEHKISGFYSNYNNSSGSSFITYLNYNYAPHFITYNNSVNDAGQVVFNNLIGNDKHSVNYSLRFDKRFKNKLALYSNLNFFYSKSESGIQNQINIVSTSVIKNKLGIYSRFLKGINFNLGVDSEFTNYNIKQQNIEALASIIKPFIIFNGAIKKNKVNWNLGCSYSEYKTDLNQEFILNIYPSLFYSLNDSWEFSVSGNNIFNIDNTEISQNINTPNYTESSIVDTLEGYIVIGASYKL